MRPKHRTIECFLYTKPFCIVNNAHSIEVPFVWYIISAVHLLKKNTRILKDINFLKHSRHFRYVEIIGDIWTIKLRTTSKDNSKEGTKLIGKTQKGLGTSNSNVWKIPSVDSFDCTQMRKKNQSIFLYKQQKLKDKNEQNSENLAELVKCLSYIRRTWVWLPSKKVI